MYPTYHQFHNEKSFIFILLALYSSAAVVGKLWLVACLCAASKLRTLLIFLKGCNNKKQRRICNWDLMRTAKPKLFTIWLLTENVCWSCIVVYVCACACLRVCVCVCACACTWVYLGNFLSPLLSLFIFFVAVFFI